MRQKPRIRCSQLPQLLSCHGSRILIPRVRARPGKEALEGKVLHYLSAKRLVEQFGAQVPPGGLVDPTAAGYKLKSNSAWIVDWYVNLVKFDIPVSWSLEVETTLEWEFKHWILDGHPDVIGTSADSKRGHGKDLKTGNDPVLPAEWNEQVLGYLVLQVMNDGIEYGRFDIAQPLVSEEDGYERVSTLEREGGALRGLVSSLDERVCEALQDAGALNSGPKQCKWCPVGIQCPSIQAELTHLRTLLTPQNLARIRAEPDDALLGDIIISVKTVEKAIKDAGELLKERLGVVGTIVAGDGTRISQKLEGGKYKVLDPVKVLEELLDMIDVDRLAPALQFSRGRIEDAIAAQFDVPKAGSSSEQTAEMIFDARIGPYLEQGTRSKLVFQ